MMTVEFKLQIALDIRDRTLNIQSGSRGEHGENVSLDYEFGGTGYGAGDRPGHLLQTAPPDHVVVRQHSTDPDDPHR